MRTRIAIAAAIVGLLGAGSALIASAASPVAGASRNGAAPSGHAHASAASRPGGPGSGGGPTPARTAPDDGRAALQSALAAALGGNAGCVVAERDGQVVAAVNANGPVIPASTQKLVVAAAALSALGPDYRFVTKLVTDMPVVNGMVPRLWLVGSGDPMLGTADYGAVVAAGDRLTVAPPITPLEWLAGAVAQAGIRSVPAGVVGDDSLLSAQRYLPTWTRAEIGEDDVGPLSALTVNEGWARWRPAWAAASDPPADAVGRIEGLMHADGVAVGGIGLDGPAPPDARVVASVASVPLSSIVAYMLATSDNHIAELLTRMVGLKVSGTGTTAAGTAAVLEVGARLGVPTAGVTMVDGSGLSRQNAATCTELLAAYRLGSDPRFAAIRAGLPIAGETGLMADEFQGTPAQGRVIAKGGWIDGVAGLVGSAGGPRGVDFAFVANGTFDFAVSLALDQQAMDALVAYTTPGAGP
ncbi:MAG TPA: D-alanyl-D-alanine carboxypeptidase [Acidimicrobiales bacterium]|nr:D-alanyl-D-alanine carboxypeptidase [Acidimicrobiales bacterium]